MEGSGDDYFFDLVLGGGDIFIEFKLFEGGGILRIFVGDYIVDSFVEDLGRSMEVEGIRFFGVDNVLF